MEQPAESVQKFIRTLEASALQNTLVKLTLSKPASKDASLKNIYGRGLVVKGEPRIAFTLRFETRDEARNFSVSEGLDQLEQWLGEDFLHAELFTLTGDHTLLFNRRRKSRMISRKPSFDELPQQGHDRQKKRFITGENNVYLKKLGITNAEGKVLKSGQKKYRQINKYIEIVAALMRQHPLPAEARIVDMGAGKGYLTFALYDYLKNWKDLSPQITGVELRDNLVVLCNEVAEEAGFKQLSFIAEDIGVFETGKLDMLIALHACDTATDVALAKGIRGEAGIIIVAPCCHRQIREQMDCRNELEPMLRHGILAERQAEILTDGLRALLLEAHGYETKVFEFVSTEHAGKNLMITAIKGKKNKEAAKQVQAIKEKHGIEYHFLEELLK